MGFGDSRLPRRMEGGGRIGLDFWVGGFRLLGKDFSSVIILIVRWLLTSVVTYIETKGGRGGR